MSGWPEDHCSRERAKPRIRVHGVHRGSYSEGPDDQSELVFGTFQLAFISPYCQLYTGYCYSTVQNCRRKGKAWNVSLRRLTRTVVPPYSVKVRSDTKIWWSRHQRSGPPYYGQLTSLLRKNVGIKPLNPLLIVSIFSPINRRRLPTEKTTCK